MKSNQASNIILLCIATLYYQACDAYKSELPPRVDIGILMDTYIFRDANAVTTCFTFLDEMLDKISISPGTGRVSFYQISKQLVPSFGYRSHVNRECTLKTLHKIRQNHSIPLKGTALSFLQGVQKLQKTARREATLIAIAFIGTANKKLLRFANSHKKNPAKSMKGIEIIPVPMKDKSSRQYSETRTVDHEAISGRVKVIFSHFSLKSESLTSCKRNGRKVSDECSRRCDCLHGKMVNCVRVRKEFTAMTRQERKRYIQTYLKLTSVEPFRTRYDRFIYMHYKYFCWGIHQKNLFFPWHRWYIVTMENMLREIDCRVTLPYWDWSYYGYDPWNATLSPLWKNTSYGIGRNGSIDDGFCVMTGPFSRSKWRPPYFNQPLFIITETAQLDGLSIDPTTITPDLANCLRRAMFGYLPTRENVLLSIDFFPPEGFSDFELYVRHNYHDRIHNQIGGTMCTHFAASSPEFFFHHSFLDKIWYLWQEQSNKHKYAFFVNSTTKMVGCPYAPYQFIDSMNMPNCIKVIYTEFPEERKDKRKKRSYDTESDYLDDNNRVPSSYWNDIIQTSLNFVYPRCGNNEKERAIAVSLYRQIEGDIARRFFGNSTRRK